MQSLMRGSLPLQVYVLLLRNLHYVYDGLEGSLRRVADAHPLIAWLDTPELRRAPPIAEDLEHLHGADWLEELPIVSATSGYRDAVEDVGRRWPLGLVAHAWVRYMGDVSGGQVLARLLRRHYGLGEDGGTRTYDFSSLGEIDVFKADFRAQLDEVEEGHHRRIVDEARRGFGHSIRMLDEIREPTTA